MARSRRSKEAWASIVQEFIDSDKGAKEWSEGRGIPYQSLLNWRKKLKTSPFVELKEPLGTFELRWKGIKIELSSFEELKELGELLVRC